MLHVLMLSIIQSQAHKVQSYLWKIAMWITLTTMWIWQLVFDPVNPVFVATEREIEEGGYDDVECQLCEPEEVAWLDEYGEMIDDDTDSVYTAFSDDA